MILVTGAAGRLGRQVVRLLLDRGYDVRGTDIVSFDDSPIPYVQADLGDRSAISDMMRGVDAVIHLGAIPGPGKPTVPPTPHDPYDIFETNIAGTFNVLMSAMEHKVRRVVFSSSAFALGWARDPLAFVPKYLPLDEEHPLMPFEAYGLSKQMGECIAGMVARSSATSIVSLRFTNVVTIDRQSELPWPAPTLEKPLTLLMWAYADPRDVVTAHLAALEAKTSGHEAFLLAQPITRFREPTRELIRQHFGDDVEIRSELPDNASIINTAKAARLLGWKPLHRWDRS